MAVGIPTTSYIYDSDGDVQPMPDAFYAQSVMRSVDGQEYTDLFVHDDCLYVLCSDGRIVTDQGGEVVLLERSGEPYPFLSARGLFIDDDSYYIADFEAMKVVRFDRSTLIVDLEISKPGGYMITAFRSRRKASLSTGQETYMSSFLTCTTDRCCSIPMDASSDISVPIRPN